MTDVISVFSYGYLFPGYTISGQTTIAAGDTDVWGFDLMDQTSNIYIDITGASLDSGFPADVNLLAFNGQQYTASLLVSSSTLDVFEVPNVPSEGATSYDLDITNNDGYAQSYNVTLGTTLASLPSGLLFSDISLANHTIGPGQSTTVNCQLTNYAGDAPASTLTIYLSSDLATYNSSDIILAEVSLSAVPSNSDIGVSTQVKLPSNLAPGNYYIGIVDSEAGGFTSTAITVPGPPPAGTTAVMIMSNPSNGDYEIYNIGGNAILAAYLLGQVGSPWSFVGMGTFQAGDTSDMLLRNTSTGQFEAYYISNNNITNAVDVGAVGTNWNFAGTGDFDGQSSLSELLLRNSDSGAFELYQVAGGGVLSGSSVGAVGGNFTVEGFGHFSESSSTQMLMQGNSGASAGQLELYNYQPGAASFAGIDVGDVGSNLTFLGCADLLGNGSTQMVMQQNNGDLWLYTYDPSANALSGTEVGAVGSNFHVVGFGPFGTSGQDEMLMQNAAGDFEVYQYNASENAFAGSAMGAVGSPWVVDGIVGTDPPASGASAASASAAQLVQAMASTGGGGSITSASSAPLGLGTLAQTLLTTPQHA